MNHLNAREIRRLRLGLGGGEPKESLLHLLTCSHCRRRAAVQTFLAEDWALGEVTPEVVETELRRLPTSKP